MSNKPTWTNVGRATTAQYWTPSATSVRSTIAEHAVSNKNYSPPSHLRRPFGEVSLQSTSETDYRTANQHTSFLNRTTKLRNSMSASGLSFIRDIAEAIPLIQRQWRNNPIDVVTVGTVFITILGAAVLASMERHGISHWRH